MLSMAQRIDSNSGSIHMAYDANATMVLISVTTNGDRAQVRIPVEDFDKMVEQYMYLRQFTNGRRAR